MARRRQSKGPGGLILVLVVLLAIMGIGFAVASLDDGSNNQNTAKKQVVTMKETTKKKTTSNYTPKAIKDKIVKKVDEVLEKEPPKKVVKGRLALVIDDCGNDVYNLQKLVKLPLNMTYAIIPFQANSKASLQIIRNADREAIIHLPMEPIKNDNNADLHMIKVSMTKDKVQSMTKDMIKSLPGTIGMNNHMGSRASSYPATVKAVMEVVNDNGMFFLDSRTTSNSKIESIARTMGVPTAHNNIFLDNSTSVLEIKRQMEKAKDMAIKNGTAIAICHVRPNTVQALEENYKYLLNEGIEFVPVSKVVN